MLHAGVFPCFIRLLNTLQELGSTRIPDRGCGETLPTSPLLVHISRSNDFAHGLEDFNGNCIQPASKLKQKWDRRARESLHGYRNSADSRSPVSCTAIAHRRALRTLPLLLLDRCLSFLCFCSPHAVRGALSSRYSSHGSRSLKVLMRPTARDWRWSRSSASLCHHRTSISPCYQTCVICDCCRSLRSSHALHCYVECRRQVRF
jgi:hypothetical protein